MSFIYMWRDKARKMFYIGSHVGEIGDGYLSSSKWLNGEIRYRPGDFRRRIIKVCPPEILEKEEYRLIKMISPDEYGRKYYNIKSGTRLGNIPWNKGKTGIYSKETIDRIAKAKIGKPGPTKGKPMPSAAENGRKGAAKQSLSATGRKRKYNDDGSWTWYKGAD